jgi:hypothetical protein
LSTVGTMTVALQLTAGTNTLSSRTGPRISDFDRIIVASLPQ